MSISGIEAPHPLAVEGFGKDGLKLADNNETNILIFYTIHKKDEFVLLKIAS
ncbi:MAG: hypothetical protein U1F42_01740 [Candidatus Competibacteraceae bacterium]